MTILTSLVQRYVDDDDSSLGLFFMGESPNYEFMGYSLEDEKRLFKVKGETRIPAGYYELKSRQEMSPMTERYRAKYPWFSWHIQLMSVPNFDYVYVHIGNTDKDTDGCILLGSQPNPIYASDGFISSSEYAFKKWYVRMMDHLMINGNKAFIEIRDEPWLFQHNRRGIV